MEGRFMNHCLWANRSYGQMVSCCVCTNCSVMINLNWYAPSYEWKDRDILRESWIKGYKTPNTKMSSYSTRWCFVCKCIWSRKWILVLMTYIIKELMCLLSYEQDKKSLKWKGAINDAIFTKKTVLELHWRSFTNFYFELEYRKHRTIKGDAKKLPGDAKVLNWDANYQRETLCTHLSTFSCSLSRGRKFQLGVGSSNPIGSAHVLSDNRCSACWFRWGRKFLTPSDKGFSAKSLSTDRKFRQCVGILTMCRKFW